MHSLRFSLLLGGVLASVLPPAVASAEPAYEKNHFVLLASQASKGQILRVATLKNSVSTVATDIDGAITGMAVTARGNLIVAHDGALTMIAPDVPLAKGTSRDLPFPHKVKSLWFDTISANLYATVPTEQAVYALYEDSPGTWSSELVDTLPGVPGPVIKNGATLYVGLSTAAGNTLFVHDLSDEVPGNMVLTPLTPSQFALAPSLRLFVSGLGANTTPGLLLYSFPVQPSNITPDPLTLPINGMAWNPASGFPSGSIFFSTGDSLREHNLGTDEVTTLATSLGSTGPVVIDPCFNLPDSTPCSDGNACTDSDVCKDGQCVGGSQVTCDGGLCQFAACDPVLRCGIEQFDGDSCATDEVCANIICVQGTCLVPTGLAVADCTKDLQNTDCAAAHCSEKFVCEPKLLPADTPCGEAASKCQPASVCDDKGMCQPSAPIECGAEDDCSVPHCDDELGCVKTPINEGLPCQDPNFLKGCCMAGVCMFAATEQPTCPGAGGMSGASGQGGGGTSAGTAGAGGGAGQGGSFPDPWSKDGVFTGAGASGASGVGGAISAGGAVSAGGESSSYQRPPAAEVTPMVSEDEGDCGCETTGRPTGHAGLGLLGLLGLAVARRRRS